MNNFTIRRTASFLLSFSFLSLCIGYMIRAFQWHQIYELLKQANLLVLFLGGTASILAFLSLRALRWYLLLKHLKCKIHFLDLYLCSAVSAAFSIVTPVQSGDVVKIELLKKYSGLGRFDGYTSFAIERAFDLIIFTLLAISSVSLGWSTVNPGLPLFITLLLAFFLLIVVIRYIVVGGLIGRILNQFKFILNDPKIIAIVMLITLVIWLMVALGWQIFLHSISLKIGMIQLLAVMSIMTIVNVFSLIPGALGVSEVGIAAMLMHLGNSAPSAQAGAIAIRLYGLMTLALGCIHFLAWKIKKVNLFPH